MDATTFAQSLKQGTIDIIVDSATRKGVDIDTFLNNLFKQTSYVFPLLTHGELSRMSELMDKDSVVLNEDPVLAHVHPLLIPYLRQLYSVAKAVSGNAKRFHIAAVVLFGSTLTGIGPNSDLDILVLLREDRNTYPGGVLDLDRDIKDTVNWARVNEVKVDLHIRPLLKFLLDTPIDSSLKEAFRENNFVLWEDGHSLPSTVYARFEEGA